MPSAIQDRLPQGHLAYFINDTVASLDLRTLPAHILVAVQVVNTGPDVQQLPVVLAAVRAHTASAAG